MSAPDDPYDFPTVIKRITKAREAIRAAEDRAPRVEFRVLAEDPDVLLANARSVAAAVMAQNEMPLLFCVYSARLRQRIVLDSMPRTLAEKRFLAALLRLLLMSAPIDAYWLASEAWAASYTGVMPDKIADVDLPASRPDRGEALVISAASRSFHRLSTFHTERKGRAVMFAPADYPDMRTYNPALGNLFDDTTEAARAVRYMVSRP